MTKEASSTERALKLALEALEANQPAQRPIKTFHDGKPWPLQEPAQPQQEPVNQRAHEVALRQWEHWKQYALELQKKLVKYEGGAPMVLNTAPQPAHRTWVGLTFEEVMESWDEIRDGDWAPDFYEVIEAKLKEKNT